MLAPAGLRAAAALAACGALGACAAGGAPGDVARQARAASVDVLVLNYDPLLGRRPLHEAMGWNDPRALAEGYIADVAAASHGGVRYRIVEWRDLDEFPPKVDGFRYTEESFLRCWQDRDTCHRPDSLDYPAVLREHDVPARISSGEIDELWIFGAPYFGYWESAMAGPGAFYINGGVYAEVEATRRFAIMGFSYERGIAEMLHNLCHRTEATMTRVYGGWDAARLEHAWARFAANQHQSGAAAVGSCHFPPNAEAPYDYDNPRTVWSTAPDWLDYPSLGDEPAVPVSRGTWGSPDPGPLAPARHDDPHAAGYHRGFMRWWFHHLPHAEGVGPDGKRADWWSYVFSTPP